MKKLVPVVSYLQQPSKQTHRGPGLPFLRMECCRWQEDAVSIQLQGHVGSVVYSLGLEGEHEAKGDLQEGGVALTAKAVPEKWGH